MTRDKSIKTVNKHYELSADLIREIEKRSKTMFATNKEGLEYYLNLGLEYENYIKDQNNMESLLNKNMADTRFIKKLLIQLFVNSDFSTNVATSDSKIYYDFIKRITKGDMSD